MAQNNNKLKIGINGYGRIGRMVHRLSLRRTDVEIVGINSLDSLEGMAHLLKYDSTHGVFSEDVRTEGTQTIVVGGKKIPVSSEKEPSKIPWDQWGAHFVYECSGAMKTKEDSGRHLRPNVKLVMISAPANDSDKTFVFGVNHQTYEPGKDVVVSNASCTTNCLAPIAQVLHENFEILSGTMLTVHAYTNDQRLLDGFHKDLRRARAGAVSMIPTSTGAAKAVGLVIPSLKGKLDGLAVRVPTSNVSYLDFTCQVKKITSKEAIHEALRQAAGGKLKDILKVETEPLVSVDFNGSTFSSIVDAESTMVLGSHLVKVCAWYDNEVGFSERMLDLGQFIFHKLNK